MSGHQFGRPRIINDALNLSIDNRAFSPKRFHELPPPTGNPPFHLNLEDVLPVETIAAIAEAKRLVFHIGGDAGGIKDAVPQQLVSTGMERDFVNDPRHPEADPAFLYLLGDCVYFNGEGQQYFPQFYQPYENYVAPIFAVPGNHDGDNVSPNTSLDAFVRNFCAPEPVVTPEAGDSTRTAMTQPNVYWTLRTPLCTIIGLYTNVPEGGEIHPDQQRWLTSELASAPREKPVFVTMHHPVYSADGFHSGSAAMREALRQASNEAGRSPDVVFAGHVHAYERFTVPEDDGVVPYIVAGALGYHNLHSMVKINGQKIVPPVTLPGGDGAVLEQYVDTRHGFLHVEVTPDIVQGKYYTVPRPHESWSEPPHLADVWQFDWKNRQMIPNRLPQASVVIDSPIAAIRDPGQRKAR